MIRVAFLSVVLCVLTAGSLPAQYLNLAVMDVEGTTRAGPNPHAAGLDSALQLENKGRSAASGFKIWIEGRDEKTITGSDAFTISWPDSVGGTPNPLPRPDSLPRKPGKNGVLQASWKSPTGVPAKRGFCFVVIAVNATAVPDPFVIVVRWCDSVPSLPVHHDVLGDREWTAAGKLTFDWVGGIPEDRYVLICTNLTPRADTFRSGRVELPQDSEARLDVVSISGANRSVKIADDRKSATIAGEFVAQATVGLWVKLEEVTRKSGRFTVSWSTDE